MRDLLERNGGVVIRRQRVEKVLYGDGGPDLVTLIDFADRAVAERLFFDEEYLAIVPLRDQVFRSFRMYLAPMGEI